MLSEVSIFFHSQQRLRKPGFNKNTGLGFFGFNWFFFIFLGVLLGFWVLLKIFAKPAKKFKILNHKNCPNSNYASRNRPSLAVQAVIYAENKSYVIETCIVL